MPNQWVDLGGVFFAVDANTVITLVPVFHTASITEGEVKSVHTADDSTAYQNTTGNTAYATLNLRTIDGGQSERHIKIWSGPTADSTTSATLLWEIGKLSTTEYLSQSDVDRITTRTLKIQNNHYLTIENVQESRAGTNNVTIGIDSTVNYVIERT